MIQDPVALNRTRWSLAAGVAVVAGLALWAVFAPTHERAAPRERPGVIERGRDVSTRNVADSVPPPSAPSPVAPSPTAPSPTAAPAEPNTLNVVGPGPHDPHEPGMVPHPLDEARARLHTENRLIQTLNDAMSFRKVREMRELLVRYRELDPQDIDKNQLGYEVIADCIEFPGDASLGAARKFYDTQRHSPLRRFVRRICFENSN